MISKVSALILTDVINRIQITSADSRLTYAHLLGYAQKVYEDLYYAITEVKPEFYAKIGYLQSNANSTSCTLSANLTDYDPAMQFLAIDFKESSTADYYRGKEVSLNDLTNPEASYSWQQPIYNLVGNTLWLQPEPTTALASCGRVYFVDRASNLSGGSVYNLPDGWEDILANGIVSYGFKHLGQERKALEFLQKYEVDKTKRLRAMSHRTRTRRRMRNIGEHTFSSYYDGN